MSKNPESPAESAQKSPENVPDDLAARLAALDAAELRSVIAYAESLLPPAPKPRDLLEERPGEQILNVNEEDGHTEVVKEQPCVEGCENCPHGPYLYRIRVRPSVDDEGGPTLRWDFLGSVSP